MGLLSLTVPSYSKLSLSVSLSLSLSLSLSFSLSQYHGDTIKNIREAVETITSDPLYYRPVAIALDTKGPEIRTGLVKGVSGIQHLIQHGCKWDLNPISGVCTV